jgi:two-component system response regulator HydG
MPSPVPIRILIVDDDPGHLTALKTLIRSWGYTVQTADDGAAAVEAVTSSAVDLILMDVRMAHMGGIEALEKIKAYNPSIPIIIMTAYSSVQFAVEALKAGAYDYLIKPLDFDVLRLSIERAREHAGLKAENMLLRSKLGADLDLAQITGRSRAMKALIDMLAMVAPSEATVLITGESGTGKELIARALHFNSPRREKPLVVVNCAAITETLLESELFGHEKGAFTGADKRHEGRFMQANHGTVLLDEISETSSTMQAKLLRVLQGKEIQRVGGEEVLPVDVRVVAATNRDLEAEVAGGRFREDLFYRLNVMRLTVPPLRDRLEDVPLLAQHFVERFASRNRKTVKGITPLAMDMLLKHDWPGNVRELENTVERLVVLSSGPSIEMGDLTFAGTILSPGAEGSSLSLKDLERDHIIQTLQRFDGHKSETARALGIDRKTLREKLRRYNIE